MANKFLNVLIGGVQTPINIDDVVAVAATKGAAGSAAGKVEIFYASGKKATCLLYTSPSPRDATLSRMPSSA